MDTLLQWFTEKFKHPLSPLFFFLGVGLILLGLTQGVPVGDKSSLQVDQELRYMTAAIGILCLAVSLLIYYKPPSSPKRTEQVSESGIVSDSNYSATGLPVEIMMTWVEKRNYLTATQREILRFLEIEGGSSYRKIVDNFNKISSKEMFYRLEKLRLMSFIQLKRFGDEKSRFFEYRLSEEYTTEISKAPSLECTSITVRPLKKN